MAAKKEFCSSHFFFSLSLPLCPTPYLLIQSFISRRICFSSFAPEIYLGQRRCIGIPKRVKTPSGFEQDFKTRRDLFSKRIGWVLWDFSGLL